MPPLDDVLRDRPVLRPPPVFEAEVPDLAVVEREPVDFARLLVERVDRPEVEAFFVVPADEPDFAVVPLFGAVLAGGLMRLIYVRTKKYL